MLMRKARWLVLVLAACCGTVSGQLRVRNRQKGVPDVDFGSKRGPTREQLRRAIHQRCERGIRKAHAYVKQAKYAEACRELAGAPLDAADPDPRQKAEILRLYREIEEVGAERFAAARALYDEGEYTEALASFREIVRQFAKLPSGIRAGQALRDARTDPLVIGAMADAKAIKLARTADAIIDKHFAALARRQAQATDAPAKDPSPAKPPTLRTERIKRLDEDDMLRVIGILQRVVKQFPDTVTGMLATDDLNELEADEKFWARIEALRKAKEIRHALKRAELFHSGGLLDQALIYYRQIVEKYPGTEAAATAAKEIAKIEG